jgi:hypothetical protein
MDGSRSCRDFTFRFSSPQVGEYRPEGRAQRVVQIQENESEQHGCQKNVAEMRGNQARPRAGATTPRRDWELIKTAGLGLHHRYTIEDAPFAIDRGGRFPLG